MRLIFDKAQIVAVVWVTNLVTTLFRLAQSYVTIANQIVYAATAT